MHAPIETSVLVKIRAKRAAAKAAKVASDAPHLRHLGL